MVGFVRGLNETGEETNGYQNMKVIQVYYDQSNGITGITGILEWYSNPLRYIHYRDKNENCIKCYPCYAKYVFIVPNLILYSHFAALISSK